MKKPSTICANCGAKLHGAFCATCGQKRFDETDRRFGNLVRQFIEAFTNLDGRFWGTVRALLFQPGRLSRDYIDGRRARWLSPVTLFLFVNVVYFFFMTQSDFATPFTWEVPGRIQAEVRGETLSPAEAARLRAEPGPLHSRITAAWIDRRVAERGYDYRDYAEIYDAKVPEVSKALAALHVPFLALALMFLFRKNRRYYAEHFVVALHLVAFNMAVILLFGRGLDLVHFVAPAAEWHNTMLNWLIRIVLTVYVVIALHRTYQRGWIRTLAATAGLFAAFVIVNFYVYRPVLFVTVFALT